MIRMAVMDSEDGTPIKIETSFDDGGVWLSVNGRGFFMTPEEAETLSKALKEDANNSRWSSVSPEEG